MSLATFETEIKNEFEKIDAEVKTWLTNNQGTISKICADISGDSGLLALFFPGVGALGAAAGKIIGGLPTVLAGLVNLVGSGSVASGVQAAAQLAVEAGGVATTGLTGGAAATVSTAVTEVSGFLSKMLTAAQTVSTTQATSVAAPAPVDAPITEGAR